MGVYPDARASSSEDNACGDYASTQPPACDWRIGCCSLGCSGCEAAEVSPRNNRWHDRPSFGAMCIDQGVASGRVPEP